MDGLFAKLDDQGFFSKFVNTHCAGAPPEIKKVMGCTNHVDAARVEYAFKEYQQNLEKFAVYLHSSNPDHYKRSGALLHALYQSKIITSVTLESSPEELEAGFTRVNAGDAEHVLSFVHFYQEFYNEMLAFDLAYRCCASYETHPREYDFDYLHNVCRYLKTNPNLTVDSCFMLFKSLML
jgi:hypothetical protein